jgi:salicylate hydroxylase
VIIIGAGLGGLGAAIAIRLAGHSVTVLESAREIGEVGAGIQCLPNSTKILQLWDVHGKLASKASQTQTCNILSWKGDLISSMDFAQAGTEHGAPFNDFHRADLHAVLLARAVELGAAVHTNSEVANIEFDVESNTARVFITGQAPQVAHLVVGADGINSRCREILLGRPEPPHRTGDMAYRILLDAKDIRGTGDVELTKYLDEKAVNYWYGPGAHAGTLSTSCALTLVPFLIVR